MERKLYTYGRFDIQCDRDTDRGIVIVIFHRSNASVPLTTLAIPSRGTFPEARRIALEWLADRWLIASN